MSYTLLGQVIDINTTSGVDSVDVVICDADTGERQFSATTDGSGFFTTMVTIEEFLDLLKGQPARRVSFKVYKDLYFLGAEDIVICHSHFAGSARIEIAVDSDVTPPTEGCGYAVSGVVVEADGTPLSGVTVEVLQFELSGETSLDTAVTDSAGRFLLRYFGPAGSFDQFAQIDIVVEAAIPGQTVRIGPICNPPHDLHLTIVEEGAELRGPSDYDVTLSSISMVLSGVSIVNLTIDQAMYLACKTGIDAGDVDSLVRAHQLADALSLSAPAFYGLGRAGIPLAETALLSFSNDTLESVILAAIESNQIPPSVADDIPTVLAAIDGLRLDRFVPQVAPESTAMGAVLATTALPAGAARLFAETYAGFTGTIEEFWTEVEGDLVLGTHVPQLQFTIAAMTVVASHTPMLKLLQAKWAQTEITRASDLANYTAADWLDFTEELVEGNPVGAPAGFPGETDAERNEAYANVIARMVEDLYPTAFTAYHLPTEVESNVAAYVAQNPEFSFAYTLIEDPLGGDIPIGEDAATLRRDLLAIQRVFAIAPRYGRAAAVSALLEGGVTSAYEIANMGPHAFVTKFSPSLGGPEATTMIFNQAHKVTSYAIAVFSKTRPEFAKPLPATFVNPACKDATYQSLFGSLDYCDCRHCDSIHGPPAYFVDIMQFVKGQPATGYDSALEVLTASDRREDLMHVLLNCENTETPMPAIDLAIELLERAVIGEPAPPWAQTTWSAQDLAAHPEHLALAAYDKLRSITGLAALAPPHFPQALPFDLYLAEARGYLEHLGASRGSLLDLFDEPYPQTAAGTAQRVDEALGLSPGQAVLVRGVTAPDPEELWGFVQGSPTWVADLAEVETLLERGELTFPELEELLRTALLDGTVIDYVEPCKLAGATLSPAPTAAKLEQLQRALRLRRALGWTSFELDVALRVLDDDLQTPVADALTGLAAIARLRARFPKIGMLELLTLLGDMETRAPARDVESFYEQAVRPKLREADFAADAINNGNAKLDAVAGSLQSITRLNEVNLKAARALVGLADSEEALTLVSLSALYRVGLVTRLFKIDVEELAHIVTLAGLVDPLSGQPGAPILELLDRVEEIVESPFSGAELAYVLEGTDAQDFGESDASVADHLIGLITALQAVEVDHAATLPTEDISDLEAVTTLYPQLLVEGATTEEALGFLRGEEPASADANAAAALRDQLFPFLTSGSPLHTELATAYPPPVDAAARLGLARAELAAELLRRLQRATAIQFLAGAFALDTAVMETMLEHFPGANGVALEEFTDPAFVASFDAEADAEALNTEKFPSLFLERADVTDRGALYRELNKAALVVNHFALEGDLLRWLLRRPDEVETKASEYILDLTDLNGPTMDLDRWRWLVRMVWARDQVFGEGVAVVDFLNLIFVDDPEVVLADAVAAIADALSWTTTEINAFLSQSGLSLSANAFLLLRDLTGPRRLYDVRRLSTRLEISALTMHTWGTQLWGDDDNADALQAAAIKSSAQAKYSSARWPTVAAPLRDRLREQQRDALVAYLRHDSALNDEADFLARFLLDVEVSSCAKTSRLKSAISAVQLFVQRALISQEDAVTLGEVASEEWSWMKRYRVWEANRKIFLYPENWLSPELRDDKTPFFRELEDEIAQFEPTAEVVERAYMNYLEKLDDVARLEICGLYHEFERDKSFEVKVDRLHVFARSKGNPPLLYYRAFVDERQWTPWEELPFSAPANDLIPVALRGRLAVYWPEVELTGVEERVPPKSQADARAPTRYRKIRSGYTELRDGKWAKPRSTAGAANDLFKSFVRTAWRWTDDEKEDFAAFTAPLPHDEHWDLSITSEINEDSDLELLLRVFSRDSTGVDFNGLSLIELLAKIPLQYVHAYQWRFVVDACTGELLPHRHAKVSGDYALATLNTQVPPPAYARPHFQGFGTYRDKLWVPVRHGFTFDPSYDKLLESAPYHGEALYPRQEHRLETRRPFVFQDRRRSFLVVPTRRDAAPSVKFDLLDKAMDPGVHQSLSPIPYLALDNLIAAPVEPAAQGWPGIQPTAATDQLKSPYPPKEQIREYRFLSLYHAYTCDFISQLRRFGVPGLLDPLAVTDGQPAALVHQSGSIDLAPIYEPTDRVLEPFPPEAIDFTLGSAYSVYNWELFYHAPMYIADQLMANRQFAEAQRWLHYIFDPTRKPTFLEGLSCKHFWRIKPLREAASLASIDELLETLGYHGLSPTKLAEKQALLDEIEDWRDNPFMPHRVARMRPIAYMRATFMKYLDNLIAWGDDLFRQDTIETNNEATQLYLLAAEILGKAPRKLPPRERPDADFEDACSEDGMLDAFSNFFVELENKVLGMSGSKAAIPFNIKGQADAQQENPILHLFNYIAAPPVVDPKPVVPKAAKLPLTAYPDGDEGDHVERELYFCIPHNKQLLGYWDTVADRLFKLRNCLNIEGVFRQLPLFQPPIDPGLLAKAAAQGVDIASALGALFAPLPHYRFNVHLGIAKAFTSEVSSLGAALLSALEKRDAEGLSQLRSTQEIDLLAAARALKQKAIDESQANIENIEKTKEVTQLRETYYSTREYINNQEKLARDKSEKALKKEEIAGRYNTAASIASLIPDFNMGVSGAFSSPVATIVFGGSLVSEHLNAIAAFRNREASLLRGHGALLAEQGNRERRSQDWRHQKDLARKELEQLENQLTAAKIRKEMAERELENHDLQVEQSREALDYMRDKFTNDELYNWMIKELSKLYYQAYQLAVDLARRTERCYQYELGVAGTSFVGFGHWDNRRKGLLAGERLSQDLRRMEAAYYENHRREYELTKRVSLADYDPAALLTLKKTGRAYFTLPEALFDLDHPGHYFRRLKMVGLSLPAIGGGQTSFGATLTYESGKIRTQPSAEALTGDPNGGVQTIATSNGEDDTGLFEPNLRDERYLPFEGKGAVDSYWRVELPVTVRGFDYSDISDLVLTIRYTAREGGALFKSQVEQGLRDTELAALPRAENIGDPQTVDKGLVRVFSARAEFPESWRTFLAAGADNGAAELELEPPRSASPTRRCRARARSSGSRCSCAGPRMSTPPTTTATPSSAPPSRPPARRSRPSTPGRSTSRWSRAIRPRPCGSRGSRVRRSAPRIPARGS
ncbi:MAG: neuraminidase-like domain-containing protein [Nannocystaceae bacterium]